MARRRPGFIGSLEDLFHPAYDSVEAVRGVSFTIEPGETVGYIGLNGAGKSTTIKMLAGILVPSAGEVRVLDMVPHRQRMNLVRRLGVVFGQRTQLWWDLPVRESFYLLKEIYEVDDRGFNQNMEFFFDTLNLRDIWDRPVRSLSLGLRMRAEIAAAFVHNPEFVILDEPTVGLDVLAKDQIRKFLREINAQRKTTILLTTHDLRDIEEICERIILIDQGAIRYEGTLSGLMAAYGKRRFVTVDLERPCTIPPTLEGVTLEQASDRRLVFSYDRTALAASDVISAIASVLPARHVTQRDSNLEDIIQLMYRGMEVS